MQDGAAQEQMIPGISSAQQQTGDGTGGFLSVGQRGSRAVSLPPNPELVHSRPGSVAEGGGGGGGGGGYGP
jgi:hypothetical protein